jgi:protein-S-isoprenylcysteine O-methyltransferase Ste14
MNTNVIRRLVQVFLILFIQGVILFAAAGTLFWKWAWILLLLSVVILIINLLVIPVELIEERGRLKKDAKKWDKVLTSINIVPTILLYVCSGLDYRFNLTGNVNILINIAGLVLSFSGAMLFTWSMISNKFFSTQVRLQTDRKHTVATGGPYRFVRHPGYVGYIIMSFATPMALGTLWGLIFSGITGILLIIRTALEDNTLKRELAGYDEYAEKVKYRLIPFLW